MTCQRWWSVEVRPEGDPACPQVDVRRQHVKRVQLTGCPKEEGWPRPEQVLALCRTRPGFPVTFQVRPPPAPSGTCQVLPVVSTY